VRDDRAAGYTTPAAVWFAYSPDRKGQHPRAHLKNFSGILQADGYAGFAQLYRSGSVQEAACWAHARRKFYDVYKDQSSPLAAEVLQRIAALYAIESEIRGQPPDLRKAARQSRASPLLEQLHAWLSHTLTQLSKKSALGGAIFYALNRWQALVCYCDDGRIEIDNNAARRRFGSQKLSVRGFRCRWRASRCNLQPGRLGQTQRPEPASLFDPRAGADRRPPDQSGGRTIALERLS
jgi:hypothetical protein